MKLKFLTLVEKKIIGSIILTTSNEKFYIGDKSSEYNAKVTKEFLLCDT